MQSSSKMSLFVALIVATSAMAPPRTVKAVLTRDGKVHNLRFLSGHDQTIDGQSFLAALKRAAPSQMSSVGLKPTPIVAAPIKTKAAVLAATNTNSRLAKRARSSNFPCLAELSSEPVSPEKKAEDIAKATAALGIATQQYNAAAKAADVANIALAAAVAKEGEAAEASSAAASAATAADAASAAGAAAAAAATAAAAAELELNPVADAAEVYFDAQEVDLVAAAAAANTAATAAAATLTAATADVAAKTSTCSGCNGAKASAAAAVAIAAANLKDAQNE